MHGRSRVSVIVPAHEEGRGIEEVVLAARSLDPAPADVVVADVGSSDGTAARAVATGAYVVHALTNRADALNLAARHATGEALLFLHPGTRLPRGALASVERALSSPGSPWGRRIVGGAFRLAWDPPSPGRRAFATACTASAQLAGAYRLRRGLFVRRRAFEHVGGFDADAPDEGVDLSRRLAQIGRLVLLPDVAVASARDLEAEGLPRAAWRTLTASARSYRR